MDFLKNIAKAGAIVRDLQKKQLTGTFMLFEVHKPKSIKPQEVKK